MRILLRVVAAATFGLAVLTMGHAARADYGQPSNWQFGLQGSASSGMDSLAAFHNFLLVIITLITLFVLALLVTVIVKFNARANPTPTRTTHNTLLEVLWTVVPVAILVVIAIPSFRLLFYQLDLPAADLTVKATGKQWYWSYAYPDSKFEFDSIMLQDKDREKMNPVPPRLLAADNAMVVPVHKVIRVQVIGADVIHAFAVPSCGVKIDAIPGRLNETWFRASREGIYYGQCSELCGKDHAFMPIEVRVVSEQAFATWLEEAKKKYASDQRPETVASAEQPK